MGRPTRLDLRAPGARILITGATSGLGREMARQYGRRGARLAITGRRAERLAETATIARDAGAAETLELVGSVCDPETVAAHAAKVIDRFGGVDLAILNAGVGHPNDAREFDAGAYRDTLDTNVLGACLWIERVLPGMLERGAGVIAGISSPGGWRGFPGVGPYSASKAALSTMLESIRVDLRGSGVAVVDVCPGFVKSEMTAKNDPRDMPIILETEDGVRRIITGIDRRRRVVHFPRRLTGPLRYLVRPAPGWLYDTLIARLARRRPRVEAKADADADAEANDAQTPSV
ncbi:MAG: SDR family NAD(P)-dependent oxidoreductase [Phycisphaerales bacterium]